MTRLVLLAVLLGGCDLYFDVDGHPPVEDDVCPPSGADPPSIDLRDPSTGICEAVGGGTCPNPCEPCAGGVLLPNWAQCDGRCEAIADAATCMMTAQCRAVYRDDHTGTPPQFFGCWGTAQGATSTGMCDGLDAQTCSLHDNCSAIYNAGANGADAYARCLAEPLTHDPGLCAAATCTVAPPTCGTGMKPGVLAGCYTGYCIPTASCGQRDAGTCELATCAASSPICPAGTVPGTRNHCYTGFCIPTAACP